MAIANALQLKGRQMSRQSFSAVSGQICTAHAPTLSSDQNDIVIDSATLIS